MCWVSRIKPKLQVTSKNFVVYKKVFYAPNGSCTSMFYKHIYEPDSVNPVINLEVIRGYVDARFIYYYIDKGYHSYRYLKNIEVNAFTRIAKFTIPKGSLYYINEYNEVVSNTIIFNKLL